MPKLEYIAAKFQDDRVVGDPPYKINITIRELEQSLEPIDKICKEHKIQPLYLRLYPEDEDLQMTSSYLIETANGWIPVINKVSIEKHKRTTVLLLLKNQPRPQQLLTEFSKVYDQKPEELKISVDSDDRNPIEGIQNLFL